MVNAYYTVVTDYGVKEMTDAISNERKVNIAEFAVGDGGSSECAPSTEQTGLVNEVWRGEVNACRISEESENLLIIESVIPSDVGGFTIREMGIYDNKGGLIAVCNTPDTQKVKVSDGVVHELVLSMEIALSNTDSVQLVVDPTVVVATKKDIQDLRDEIGNKQEAAEGKGLSTNDFTNEEKEKLNNIEKGANKTVVDAELSETSENPVQNKAVTAAIAAKGAPVLIQETAPSDTSALWVW